MAKISPVSIKYMIVANFSVEGSLEKPDVVGALFGQTEGLLGADLELRDLQKEGKIGRIEVDLEKANKRTFGTIKIPTALDQSETTLIAAAIETIDRIGPSDAQIEVEKIEDVRGSKREYILERAKKLMTQIQGSTDSREITNELKGSSRLSVIGEYGADKLPCGDLSGNEIIVVEGRADVVNLVRNGIKNVIGMNGTKMSDDITKLGEEKELTLFLDGDRGGKLIAQNVTDNANIKYIAIAPEGKEVEELTGKEIFMNLRKKIPVKEYLLKEAKLSKRKFWKHKDFCEDESESDQKSFEKININEDKIKEIAKSAKGRGIILNKDLDEIKNVSSSSITSTLKRIRDSDPKIIILDGTLTKALLKLCKEKNIQAIAAKNFSATDSGIKLISF